MSDVLDALSTRTVLEEFATFMIGDLLGRGSARTVFDHPYDQTKVIKVENTINTFQNMMEWQIWQDFKFCDEVSRWLAPCHYISHSGTFLIMDKARDLLPEEVPKRLPQFLTDHKPENFGILEDRVVCRDYGLVIFTLETKMRKWSED